jgi:opacity protein-like surface antigen
MKSPTTIFGLIAAIGMALSAGANVIDPNETLPDWIWPTFKLITAAGIAGAGYHAADWKRKEEPDKPSETKPTSENKP